VADYAGALALVAVTVPVFLKARLEFMPPLDEGALLFMPTTLPAFRLAEAQRLMQRRTHPDAVPEVERVLGKPAARRHPPIPRPSP